MAIKLLTGEHIHATFTNFAPEASRPWEDLGEKGQEAYNVVAKFLNQDLGLCEECGNRPKDGEELYEVAGDNICSDCLASAEQPDPNVQWIWAMFNEQNELISSVVLPDGMTMEDYQKQLKEEMSHISFELRFPRLEGVDSVTVKTLPELHSRMIAYLHMPSDGHGYTYTIHIFKDKKIIGTGIYKRKGNGDIEIVNEYQAAEGLNDLLYEYAFAHA